MLAENVYLLSEGKVYRYEFPLICCKVGWTKLYCAFEIFYLFCNIIFRYIRIVVAAVRSNLSNFQIFPLLKIDGIIFFQSILEFFDNLRGMVRFDMDVSCFLISLRKGQCVPLFKLNITSNNQLLSDCILWSFVRLYLWKFSELLLFFLMFFCLLSTNASKN